MAARMSDRLYAAKGWTMAKRNSNSGAESGGSQKPRSAKGPKLEIDFENLIAAGIAAAVIKRPKKRRVAKPKW
jgi:hypothetical protein